MRDFLRRIRLPLLFAALLLITTILMVVDRRTMSEGGSDHSWLSGVLIEIAAPIQKVIRLPVDFLGETCKSKERKRSSYPCGLGAELALLLPPLIWLSRRRRRLLH
jgi:hypothetical protein